MPDLHQILLQDMEGSSAGRRLPHEHPGLLQCSAHSASPAPGITTATLLLLHPHTMHVFLLRK